MAFSTLAIWPVGLYNRNPIWYLFFDGGFSSSKVEGGAGYVLVEGAGGDIVSWGAMFSGDGGSNNVEEYRGLLAGLLDVKERRKTIFDLVVVVGDSKLVIDQMRGKCNVGEKLCHLYQQALDTIVGMKTIFRWIPREINEGADTMTHVARDNKDLFEPCDGKSKTEWISILKPLFRSFNEFLEIVGKNQDEHDLMEEVWELSKYNAYGKMKRSFNLMKGDRAYFSTHECRSIRDGIMEEASNTCHTGEEQMERWNVEHHQINSKILYNVNDMMTRADETTLELESLKWKLPKLIKKMRK